MFFKYDFDELHYRYRWVAVNYPARLHATWFTCSACATYVLQHRTNYCFRCQWRGLSLKNCRHVCTGGVFGRGFGQSIQKFDYLPEAIGDSIFAVYAQEFGFLGTVLLVIGLVFLGLRGYKTASESDDIFGTLLVVGFITLIISQAFLNIAAMTGMAPLSGLPLPFISHGGTALFATLASLGIVLNVSKYRTFKKAAVVK